MKKYTLIRLRPDNGFMEHPNTEARLTAEGKIHRTCDGELYAFISPGGDVAKLKAIMINRAISMAAEQIKSAEERIEKLRGMRP